jgi:O-antigen/teichoic acid export membrane protein
MSYRRQGVQLIIGRVLAYMFSMLLPIILVRVFTVDNYGYFQQINTITLSLITVVQFGFPVSLLVFYKQSENKSLLVYQSILSVGFISLVVVFLILFSNGFIHLLFSEEVPYFIRILIAVAFIFGALAYFIENLFIVEGKKNYIIYYHIIDKSIKALLILSMAIIFKDVVWLITGLCLYFLVRFVGSLGYVLINYPISKLKKGLSEFKEQVNFALPMGLSKVVGVLGKKADHFILISTLSSASYAIYSTASFGIPFISLIYTSFGSVLLPKLSQEAKNNNTEMIKVYWHKLISLYSILTIPFILFFYVIADPFIRFLFTDQYSDSVLIYQIFLFIVFFQSLSYGTILKSFKKTKVIFYSNLISLSIALPLSFFGIQYYGVLGGSVAAVTTYGFNAIIQLFYTGKLLQLSHVNILPFRFILRMFIMSTPSLILAYIITLTELNNLLKIMVGGTLFFGSLYVMFTFGKVIKVDLKNRKIHFPLLNM